MRALALALVLAAASTSSADPLAGLRRHSQLSDDYKQWLGEKGYLEGVVGLVPTLDGRVVAARDVAANQELLSVP